MLLNSGAFGAGAGLVAGGSFSAGGGIVAKTGGTGEGGRVSGTFAPLSAVGSGSSLREWKRGGGSWRTGQFSLATSKDVESRSPTTRPCIQERPTSSHVQGR